MFVDYSIEVPLPERLVAESIISHASEMEGMGAVAYREGEELRGRVGPGGLLAKEVVIGMGKPFMSRRGAVVPVRWRATGAEALFPSLDGELSIEAGPGGTTHLDFRATYQPPLGAIGDLMDQLLLARVARATAANWVERIADWLVATSPEGEDHFYERSRSEH